MTASGGGPAGAGGSGGADARRGFAFLGARLLPVAAARIERGYLLTSGERIESLGPGDPPARALDGRTAVPLDGATLLPGLIDAHVHLCLPATADPVRTMREDGSGVTLLKAARAASRTLAAGFTTVRDLGAPDGATFALRRAIRAGVVPGPRLVLAGGVVCMTGGHAHWIGREVDGPDAVRRAVREELKAGADVIKVIATGGVLTEGVEPGAPQLGDDELRVAVEEAARAGRPVAAHAQGRRGIAAALRAGVRSIEHGFELDDELVALMRREGRFLVPTVLALRAIADGERHGVPAWAADKARRARERHETSIRRAFAAGVPIALGTDAGTPFNEHGDNAREIGALRELGLSPEAALRAATAGAAELLGVRDRTGALEPGLAADLLAVRGSPEDEPARLADPAAILHVFLGGERKSGAAPWSD